MHDAGLTTSSTLFPERGQGISFRRRVGAAGEGEASERPVSARAGRPRAESPFTPRAHQAYGFGLLRYPEVPASIQSFHFLDVPARLR